MVKFVTMYHATLDPKHLPEAEAAKLGPEWSEKYIHTEYPKWKFHRTKKGVIIKDAQEEAALGPGWTNSQGAFNEEAAIVTTERSNALRWVDEWQVPGLLAQHREKIKAKLFKAQAAFYRKSPTHTESHIDPMQLAFSGIAEVLFEAQILTPKLLENEIGALVWDSAIAGGWWRPASDERTDGFPEQFGHYWVWADHSKDWAGLFRAENAEWLGRLLEGAEQVVQDGRKPVRATRPQEAPGQQTDRQKPIPAKDRHLELLELILKDTTLEKWAKERHLARTTVFAWKSCLEAGKPLKGKVSSTKAAVIQEAIDADAKALGLTTRTDSD